MGSSCSGTVQKRRASFDAPCPIATVDISKPVRSDLALESGNTMSEEDASKALEDLQSLSKEFPQDKRVQLYRGIGLYVKGFREAAINPLRIGIQGNDQYVAKGCYMLGVIYMGRSNFSAARTFFEKGLSLKPGDVALQLKLCELTLTERSPRAALTIVQSVLSQDPTNPEAQSLLGQCHLSLGNTDAAIPALNNALNSTDKSYKTYYALGNAYRRKEMRKEAVMCYREAIALSRDTGFFLHYFSLATVYLEMDLVVEAIEHFRRGMEYGKDAEKVMGEKGFDLLFTPGELPSVLESLYRGSAPTAESSLSALADSSSNPIAYFFLALSHFKRDSVNPAKSYFLRCALLLQKLPRRPLHRFLHSKTDDFLQRLDVPTEENLQLGDIDEEHARGLIKELNTHSTPLSQLQSPSPSPDQSIIVTKERPSERELAKSVPAEGFKVRAESLESSHTPKRVRAPSPSETVDEDTRSPRHGPSTIKKFLPRVEPHPADCALF